MVCLGSIVNASISLEKPREMMFEIKWENPIELKRVQRQRRYTWDRSKILMTPGVYIFGWIDDKKFQAIYIGRTIQMKQRLNAHHHGDALMDRLIALPNDPKVLFIGYVFPEGKTEEVRRKALAIIQKALVRYYVAKDHNLHNVYGESVKKHLIMSKNAPQGLNDSISVESNYDGSSDLI